MGDTAPVVLRIGLIGAGGMGSFHARTLGVISGVQVSLVADTDLAAAERLAAEVGARATNDAGGVAERTDLDGVVIASPDETHAELALASIAAGVPVLCEKPLATSLSDARRVVAAEGTAGRRRLQLGFMRVYDVAHQQLATALEPLGSIHHVRCVHTNANAFERPAEVVVGQSIVHDLHTIRFLTGQEIIRVSAGATRRPSGAIRQVVVLARLAGGGLATIEFDDAGYAYEVRVEVTADDGAVVSGSPTRPTIRRDAMTSRPVGTDWFARFAGAYRTQDAAWIDSIRDGTAVGPTAWDGLAAHAAVEAILTSLETGDATAVEPTVRPPLFAT